MTKQERAVIYFLIAMLALGLAVKFCRQTAALPALKIESVRFSKEKADINEIIRQRQKVKINTATAKDFERLPGIGPALAERIVEYRDQSGDFLTTDDFKKVKGIGPKKYEAIKDYLVVE